MAYTDVIEGLQERFATITSIKQILDYEPQSLQTFPSLYFLLDSFTRSQAGQVTVMKYRVLCRLCVRWQDNERAEEELMPYVNSMAAAVDADPNLGRNPDLTARVDMAGVTDGVAVFVSIGGTLLRALDVYTEVVEKAAYQSGI